MAHREKFLHNFEQDNLVTAERAFIDRIQLTIGDWGFLGTRDQVCDTLSDLRNFDVVTPDGELVPLFKGDPFHSFKQRLNIGFNSAKNDEKFKDNSPLISGNISFSDRYRRPEELRNATSSIQFNTSLNLTRFIQAQRFKQLTNPRRPPKLRRPLALAISRDEKWFRSEAPLIDATNLIVGHWSKYSYANSRPAASHFARYLRLVDLLLNRAILASTPDQSPTPLRKKFYSLREIEFYWEFDCNDPITYVVNSLPRIRSAATRFFEGAAQPSGTAQTTFKVDQQSPNIKAQIANGTWLRMYAKTTKRVRFEIVLNGRIIGRTCGGQTASTRRDLIRKINSLASFAASKFNPIFQSLQNQPLPRSTASTTKFLFEVSRSSPDPYIAEAIIGSLLTFGRISLYANSPFRDPVHSLRKKGILQPQMPRSRNYVATPEYQDAVELLKTTLS